jgi:hypothetical protein
MSDVKQAMVSEIAAQLTQMGVHASYGNGADIIIDATFLDAAWSTGRKQVRFEASVLLDEARATAFMWQKTSEVGQGFSFGFSSESYIQTGKTLFRKVKAVQYAPDGMAYEYDLDLGAITKTVEETARRYGWRFNTVLSRQNASYPPGGQTSFVPPPPPASFTPPHATPPPPASNPVFCSHCGQPLAGRFCENCGNSVEDVTKPAAAPPPIQNATPAYSPPPSYNAPPAYINPRPPAVKSSLDKEALLFWGAWGLLALLSVILLITGITFMRFFGFAALLLFPILTKKILFKKLLTALATWGGIFVVFVLVAVLFPPAPANVGGDSPITIGKTVTAVTETISTAGGVITVAKSGDPLDGFELTIPADSFDGNVNFNITYAEVEEHDFGPDFNPVTPLITVDNGGKYSNNIMQVRVPVEVPEDYFAMGFFYDEDTGRLEGMPLLARDAESVTLGTRHFSSFIVSMIKESLIKDSVDSGFRPGVDDWEFTNYGSYIAPGGHCAGQTMTAMWYYVTRPDGANVSLYGRYDNNGETATPAIWQDNSLGYRFASVIQYDEWNDETMWRWVSSISDETTLNLFAYAMQVTGEPQFVAIWSSKGGGHAMIVYRIRGGDLYIADPNYPGNIDRRIQYIDGVFKPYNSGANAEEIAAGNGKAYETIQYWAKSAIVDYGHIGARWQEVKNRTIGNGIFPQYQFMYSVGDNAYQPLSDGLILDSNKIKIYVKYSDINFGVYVFRDGAELPYDTNGAFELKPGINKLGIYITKPLSDSRIKYVDFKYITVYSGGLALSPPIIEGEPGKTLTFDAVMSFALPDKYKIEWLVDGVLKQSGAELTCRLTFRDAGNYLIEVRLIDDAGNVVLEDSGTAIIRSTATTSTSSSTTTTSTSTSTTSQTTTSTTSTTIQTTQTITTEGYDYAAALAAWVADFTAQTNARVYDDGYCRTTLRLEWVVSPYIEGGEVLGAYLVWYTDTYYAGPRTGETNTYIALEMYDSSYPGVLITLSELKKQYPQY